MIIPHDSAQCTTCARLETREKLTAAAQRLYDEAYNLLGEPLAVVKLRHAVFALRDYAWDGAVETQGHEITPVVLPSDKLED